MNCVNISKKIDFSGHNVHNHQIKHIEFIFLFQPKPFCSKESPIRRSSESNLIRKSKDSRDARHSMPKSPSKSSQNLEIRESTRKSKENIRTSKENIRNSKENVQKSGSNNESPSFLKDNRLTKIMEKVLLMQPKYVTNYCQN